MTRLATATVATVLVLNFFSRLLTPHSSAHKQPQKIRKKSKAFTVSEMNRRGVGMAGIIKQKEQAVKIKILVISVLNYSV